MRNLARPVPSRIGTGGTLYVGDAPFFPFGFYCVDWRQSRAQLEEALDAIAGAGFNTIHSSVNAPWYGQFLETAERKGVKVVSEFDGELSRILDFIEKHRSFPSVLAWNITDDADSDRFTAEQLEERNAAFKRADPLHVTYTSISNRQRFDRLMPIADVTGVQIYPIPNEIPDSVTYTLGRAARTAQSRSRPFWANLQTFAWPGRRPPSADEAINMTYQALVNGAKGILFYAFRDRNWDVRSVPQLWSALQNLPAQIGTLEAFILEGQSRIVATGRPGVNAREWKLGSQTLVIVVNSFPKEADSVSVPLTQADGLQLERTYPPTPQRMRNAGGRLHGSLRPLEVQVWARRGKPTPVKAH